MKKFLAIAVLVFGVSFGANAAVTAPIAVSGSGGAAFFPFAGAIGLAAFVVYADSAGIQFPLCGFQGLTCYAEYPRTAQ